MRSIKKKNWSGWGAYWTTFNNFLRISLLYLFFSRNNFLLYVKNIRMRIHLLFPDPFTTVLYNLGTGYILQSSTINSLNCPQHNQTTGKFTKKYKAHNNHLVPRCNFPKLPLKSLTKNKFTLFFNGKTKLKLNVDKQYYLKFKENSYLYYLVTWWFSEFER